MKNFRKEKLESASKNEPLSRRCLLSGIAVGLFTAPSMRASPTLAHEMDSTEIVQPVSPGDRAFVDRAFEMKDLAIKLGDQPYGAVVVRQNRIIGQSWSRVILDRDPTGHAEMSAIRAAAQRDRSGNLNDSILYSSSRPCPMCEAAAYWAGIRQMVYGKNATSAGKPNLC